MKIKWLKHPTCPELNNTEEHVSRSVAEIAIGFRQAEFVPYKNYVERLNAEGREGRDPNNVCVPFVVGVQYTLGLANTGAPCIFRKQATETAIILDVNTAKAFGVPKNVVEQFAAKLDAADGSKAAAALHAAKLEQQQRDATFGK